MSTELPPCGLYRTTKQVGSIEAGRLVYFHNHGDPGPGLYLPETWQQNRAKFSERGMTVPADFDPKSISALPPEGFYRVTKDFFCCEKQCTKFEVDAFVQLGFNGNGKPIVFMPGLAASGIGIPERGSPVDDHTLKNLAPLRLANMPAGEKQPEINISMPRIVVH
ncbi:MAG: hypothetical protein QM831_17565 [Kofleriaceae bacterium]